MALRYTDPFDGYTTLTQRWTVDADVNNSITAAAARTGIAGYRSATRQQGGPTLVLNAQGTWIIGVAFRTADFVEASLIAATIDAATAQGVVQINTSGQFQVLRGATVVATETVAHLVNVFYYVEFKHIIANAGGTLEARVNGSVVATFTGDTQETANATADRIRMDPPGVSSNVVSDFDDLYICDGTGSINNDYLGDAQIEYLACNADGNSEQWTPSAGSNFQNVDEADPDDDTTYNSTSTEGNKDTFGMANISLAAATIPGIQVIIRARKESAGTANIQRVYRSGVSENNGASFNPSTSYATQLEIMETDPIAVGAWTVTNLNNSEFGYAAVA